MKRPNNRVPLIGVIFGWVLFGLVALLIVLNQFAFWQGMGIGELARASDTKDGLFFSTVTASLTVVGGIGAVAYLVIKYRERMDAERDLQFKEVREAETRLKDAVEQLGSESPQVRLAGVYALADVADTYLGGYKQRVVDILCGYLRSEHNTKEIENRVCFSVVEAAITQVIGEHLRRNKEISEENLQIYSDEQLWCDCSFNFRSVTFVEPVNWQNTTWNHRVDFSRVRFVSNVEFGQSIFFQDVLFDRTNFVGEISFEKSTFEGKARFLLADFENDVNFDQAAFLEEAKFTESTFSHLVSFDSISIFGNALFDKALFAGDVCFRAARFASLIGFNETHFLGSARFTDAKFDGVSRFAETQFCGRVDFSSTSFNGYVGFFGTSFESKTQFNGARFNEGVSFNEVKFVKTVRFGGASFLNYSEFEGASFSDFVGFDGVIFTNSVWLNDLKFPNIVSFDGASFLSDLSIEEVSFESIVRFDDVTILGMLNIEEVSCTSPFAVRHLLVADLNSGNKLDSNCDSSFSIDVWPIETKIKRLGEVYKQFYYVLEDHPRKMQHLADVRERIFTKFKGVTLDFEEIEAEADS